MNVFSRKCGSLIVFAWESDFGIFYIVAFRTLCFVHNGALYVVYNVALYWLLFMGS